MTTHNAAAKCFTFVYHKGEARDTKSSRWPAAINQGSSINRKARPVSRMIRNKRGTAERVKSVASLEQNLLSTALAGDVQSLTQLIGTLTPVIQARVARQLLRLPSHKDRRQEIKDVTQDIFLYLFENSGRVLGGWDAERGMSLKNYVGLIAERQTISHLRSGRSNPWREADDLENIDEPSDALHNVEKQAIAVDNLNVLLAQLKQSLSPLGWRLFDLLYIQECSVEDVTQKLNMNADAVYAWRSRLRKQAKNCQQQLNQSLLSETLSHKGGQPND